MDSAPQAFCPKQLWATFFTADWDKQRSWWDSWLLKVSYSHIPAIIRPWWTLDLHLQSLWRGVHCISVLLQPVVPLVLTSRRGSGGKLFFVHLFFCDLHELGAYYHTSLQIIALKFTVTDWPAKVTQRSKGRMSNSYMTPQSRLLMPSYMLTNKEKATPSHCINKLKCISINHWFIIYFLISFYSNSHFLKGNTQRFKRTEK